MAIWVELTGSPSCEATMTVTAAAIAIENARIWSRSVISPPTVRISFGPYNAKPSAIPIAPIKSTHSGMPAVSETPPFKTVSAIAAKGPMALATSFAPCAKLSKAAAKIRGIVNKALMDFLVFDNVATRRAMTARINSQTARPTAAPMPAAAPNSTFQILFRPLRIR